jgi:hypothetical protein
LLFHRTTVVGSRDFASSRSRRTERFLHTSH